MKKLAFLPLAVILFALPLVLTSCDDDDDDPVMTTTVVDIATGDPNFSTLVDALTKANLVTTLQGTGPFTVFAPTNAAFDQLFIDLGVNGIADLDAATLTPILLYHVVSGDVRSNMLSNGFVPSLSDGPESTNVDIEVDITSGVVLNGSTMVTTADLAADNGVVHVIDKVLLPPTVVDMAINNADFNILVDAVVHAGLAPTLSGAGPFTVFAPTDAAFTTFLNSVSVNAITDLPAADVEAVLLNHVVSGNVEASEVMTGSVPTLGANPVNLDASSSVVINGTINVVIADIQGANGVIHVIDAVIQ
ncbi:MAG: fasciclin domain-containing protein [Bacteroidia bacterium]|nr:fasciclin domain-containing protein [Bacteroidia bacterium]